MKCMPTALNEFIATHLRSQMDYLQGLVEHMDSEEEDSGYLTSSLKTIEDNLRRIRKMCEAGSR